MQISRHWRMNAQRYRLVGAKNPDGSVSLTPKSSREAENQSLPPEDLLIFNLITKAWQPYQPEGGLVRGEREGVR